MVIFINLPDLERVPHQTPKYKQRQNTSHRALWGNPLAHFQGSVSNPAENRISAINKYVKRVTCESYSIGG